MVTAWNPVVFRECHSSRGHAGHLIWTGNEFRMPTGRNPSGRPLSPARFRWVSPAFSATARRRSGAIPMEASHGSAAMISAGAQLRRDRPTLGVLGGLGPAAGVEFLRLFTDGWPAERDQDHPRVI